MWRRTNALLCVAHDVVTGIPSDYRPQYRPRRLVMPVDSWNLHSRKRNVNPEYTDYRRRMSLARTVRKKGAFKLSTVPTERTAADAVRLALEIAERNGFTSTAAVLPKVAKALQERLQRCKEERLRSLDGSLPAVASPPDDEDIKYWKADLTTVGTSVQRLDSSSSSGDVANKVGWTIFNLLEKTTMDAPAHGFLAQLGKTFVERTILTLLYDGYPRMRSQHAQRMVHDATGLYTIGRIATQLGLVDLYGVQMEVGMWREMNVLRDRLKLGRRMATLHKERLAAGIPAQKRWYWRNVLKSAGRKLKRLPITEEDLRPRMEWLRDQVFQFIAAVEAMEGTHKATILVKRLFCSQLFRFSVCQQLIRDASKLKSESKHDGKQLAQETEMVVKSLMEDSWCASMHPLAARGHAMREAMESSGGAHAMQPHKTGGHQQVDRVQHLAPQAVVDIVEAQNAFREAQMVLRYAPFVHPNLRDAPIDVDIVVRNQVEVEESNQLHSLVQNQQFQQVQYRVARLYAGNKCIGEGKGESDFQAMQMASIHMLQHFYLQRPTAVDDDETSRDSRHEQTPPGATVGVDESETVAQPRVRSVTSESTVAF